MASNDEETRRAIKAAAHTTWRRENGDALCAHRRAYYAKNREELREKVRQNYRDESAEKREARNAYQREYAKNNRAAIRENQRRHREKNREKIQEAEHNRLRDENGEPNAKYWHNRQHTRTQRALDLETMAGRPRPEICDACGGTPDKGKSLHYDHCHNHGHFRGWLCRECNLALGNVRDDPARLLKLVAYLKRTKDRKIVQLDLSGV
jgi:post-segregation antitoxin (ccd killing protein)